MCVCVCVLLWIINPRPCVLMSKLISSGTTTKQTFHDSPRWDERFLRGQTTRLPLMSAWFSSWRRGWSPAKPKIFPCEVYCSFGRCYHFNVSSHNSGNSVVLKWRSVNVMALWPTWTGNVFWSVRVWPRVKGLEASDNIHTLRSPVLESYLMCCI